MRKLGIIGIILLSLIFPNIVKADTINVGYPDSQEWLFSNCGQQGTSDACTTFLKPSYINEKYDINYMYQMLMDEYNENYNQYEDYIINFINESKPNGDLYYNRLYMSIVDNETNRQIIDQIIVTYEDGTYTLTTTSNDGESITEFWTNIISPIGVYDYIYNPMLLYDSTFEIKNETNDTYIINDLNIRIEPNEVLETYKESEEDQYITVNLDNYNYVLLTLKNYDNKNAFQTNLEIKGQIGITPIYNYGQTSKDAITGVKVQDRCNLSYESYTNYALYILQEDLQNNVVYAIKECEENSSFKFNKNMFNIFYVTEQNASDPTVTIDGKTYHTIPFSDLPSTANKNEEENYIPGQSGSADSTGGLGGALKNIQQKMSEIWDIITFFTGFINQMFSILPEPIRIILLSAFAIAITLGLIKIFIN